MKQLNRYRVTSCAGLWIYLFYASSLANSEIPGWDDLVSVYYRIEVTNYCGLTTSKAIAGFSIERDRFMRQFNFSAAQIDSIRAEAWKAGYREWDNRGLGGFKRWCANEGKSYLEYFTEISDRSQATSD